MALVFSQESGNFQYSSSSCTEFPGLGGSPLSCFEEIIGEQDQVTCAGAFIDTGTPINTH